MFNFMNIESEMLSLNDGMRNQFVSFSAFDCCVDNNSFDVFKNDDYLLIDCTNEIDEHSFKQQVEYILETIGFFTGVYVHDTIYFFSSEDSTFLNVSFFRSVKLSGSIQFDSFLIGSEKSLNPIVFPNREIESCNRSFVEKRVINSLLAKLMSQHSSNHGIESLLFLLFYSETYALDTRSICLSALFEALRRYLEEHDNRLTASHEENKMNSEECNSFRTALSGHFNQNTIESYAKKCFVIRKPNQKLLIECFDLFGITLDSGDKNAISKRDTFLHGAIPSFDNTHSLEDEARRLYALSIRQFGLCFVLILKIIGYDGLVTNYRKMANYCETNVADDTACMIRI